MRLRIGVRLVLSFVRASVMVAVAAAAPPAAAAPLAVAMAFLAAFRPLLRRTLLG